MSFGLIVENDFREVQIDSEWQNYFLQSEGFLTSWSESGDAYCGSIDVSTLSLSSPLVGIRPDNSAYCACLTGKYASGNESLADLVFASTSGSSSMEYRIFAPLNSPSEEGYGLQVFNFQGDTCYDSNHTPLRILEVIKLDTDSLYEGMGSFPSSYGFPHSIDVEHETSSPYYLLSLCPWNRGGIHVGQYFGVGYFVVGFKRIDAKSVRIGWMMLGHSPAISGSPIFGPYFQPDPLYLLVCG